MKIINNKYLCLVFLLSITMVLPIIAEEKKFGDDNVAIVNGTLIRKDDLERAMTPIMQKIINQKRTVTNAELFEVKKKVLERIIESKLLYQKSQKIGITIEEKDVLDRFQMIKAQFPDDLEFQKMLEKTNSDNLIIKNQIREDIAIQRLIEEEIAYKSEVKEKEMKAYYNKNKGFFKKGVQIRASHILVSIAQEASEITKTTAFAKIKKIQRKLKKGGDFALIAKEFSDGPSSINGGDLGFFTKGQMVESFEKAAFSIKVGEMSDIVETVFGYHLIKVFDKKPETTISYEEVKPNLENHLKQEKTREEIGKYLKDLKKNAKIKILL